MHRATPHPALTAAAVALFAVSALLLLASPALSDGPRWRPPPASPAPRNTVCPSDMLAVAGRFCPEVEQNCLEWSDDGRLRCLSFEEPSHCHSHFRPRLRYCIDRYEWPNQRGVHPDVMVSWTEAQRLCHGRGRRLCTEDEWTFACEGEQGYPYPYGFARDATACTIDRYALPPNKVLLHNSITQIGEASRVYEATASGAMPRCSSVFGVMDMTGNVDEWVVNPTGVPYQSALMGGFWGHVRTRCRAVTRSHYEDFRYYQIGFRCCADQAAPR